MRLLACHMGSVLLTAAKFSLRLSTSSVHSSRQKDGMMYSPHVVQPQQSEARGTHGEEQAALVRLARGLLLQLCPHSFIVGSDISASG